MKQNTDIIFPVGTTPDDIPTSFTDQEKKHAGSIHTYNLGSITCKKTKKMDTESFTVNLLDGDMVSDRLKSDLYTNAEKATLSIQIDNIMVPIIMDLPNNGDPIEITLVEKPLLSAFRNHSINAVVTKTNGDAILMTVIIVIVPEI